MTIRDELRRQAEKIHAAKVKNAATKISAPIKTLRDEFAMAALTGICSNPEWSNRIGETFAHAAYELADEMLAERLVSTDNQDETHPI